VREKFREGDKMEEKKKKSHLKNAAAMRIETLKTKQEKVEEAGKGQPYYSRD
jgi:hypothetical protein